MDKSPTELTYLTRAWQNPRCLGRGSKPCDLLAPKVAGRLEIPARAAQRPCVEIKPTRLLGSTPLARCVRTRVRMARSLEHQLPHHALVLHPLPVPAMPRRLLPNGNMHGATKSQVLPKLGRASGPQLAHIGGKGGGQWEGTGALGSWFGDNPKRNYEKDVRRKARSEQSDFLNKDFAHTVNIESDASNCTPVHGLEGREGNTTRTCKS